MSQNKTHTELDHQEETIGVSGSGFPPPLIVGANRLFESLDLYPRSSESDGLEHKSRGLKKAVCSNSEGWGCLPAHKARHPVLTILQAFPVQKHLVWGLGCWFQGFGFRVSGLGFGGLGLEFRVLGFGCRVQGLGFRV